MPEGADLPVQDRRDNYWIVREVRVVAAAVTAHGWHPVEGYYWSHSRMRIGRQLHHLAIPSYRQVFPILWIVPGHQDCRLHFPRRFFEEIPGLLLLQHVRYCRDRIDLHSLLTRPVKGEDPALVFTGPDCELLSSRRTILGLTGGCHLRSRLNKRLRRGTTTGIDA